MHGMEEFNMIQEGEILFWSRLEMILRGAIQTKSDSLNRVLLHDNWEQPNQLPV